MTKGFMSAAWKEAQATAKRQTKARDRASKPPPKKKVVKDNTRHCDLCGRGIRKDAVIIGPGEVWCGLCRKRHTLYPTPCESCDGYFHFPPGITDITSIEHAAMVADVERLQERFRDNQSAK